MARRKRIEPSGNLAASAAELDRRLHHYVTFLMAREAVEDDAGSARTQLAEDAIHDEARRSARRPVEQRLEAMEGLLAELGLLEAARRHADHLETHR